MVALALLLVVFATVAFAAGFIVATRTRKRDRTSDARAATPTPAPAACSFVRFDPIASRGTRSTVLEDQSHKWRVEMRAVGARLHAANVSAVVFVHGTFVGADPLGLARLARRALPRTGSRVAQILRDTTRARIHAVLGDLGTFSADYVALFERAIGSIPCTRFEWSSENHHLGRLEAAIDLARVIAVHAAFAPRARVVLVGHSHGGQIFALLAHLLAGGVEAAALLDVARARGIDVWDLDDVLALVRGCALDVVTQGSAARYEWNAGARMRAMHLVNEGDAIRRLAAPGSDLPASTRDERELNARLVPLLGAGTDARALLRNVAAPARADAAGQTYVVDYGARGFWQSGAGHGVYTRLDAMLFNARLLVDHFYPETTRRAA
jgi:pimeloyl-ACP methyl ester carboxylesterase